MQTWTVFISIILMNVVSFGMGFFVRYSFGEWKLKLIERNLLEFQEYQHWLEQNKEGLKTADGKLPSYF